MASEEAKFDLLYEALKGYQTGFIDAAFKTTASLLVVAGWLMTSEAARKFLGGSPVLRRTAVVAILIAGLLYGVTSWRVYRFSQRARRNLDSLAYMPTEFYADRTIQPVTLGVFVFAIAGLCVVLSIFISALPK